MTHRVGRTCCFIVVCGVVFGPHDGNAPIRTTLCALRQDPQTYAGKMVVVRGSIGWNELWVEDPSTQAADCHAYMNITLAFPGNVMPPAAFALQSDAGLAQFQSERRSHRATEVTVEGRFDPLFVWRDGARLPIGDGHGYRAESGENGRIVVRRVSDVVASGPGDGTHRRWWLGAAAATATLFGVVWVGRKLSRRHLAS